MPNVSDAWLQSNIQGGGAAEQLKDFARTSAEEFQQLSTSLVYRRVVVAYDGRCQSIQFSVQQPLELIVPLNKARRTTGTQLAGFVWVRPEGGMESRECRHGGRQPQITGICVIICLARHPGRQLVKCPTVPDDGIAPSVEQWDGQFGHALPGGVQQEAVDVAERMLGRM